MANEKATISEEELVTGMSDYSSDEGSDIMSEDEYSPLTPNDQHFKEETPEAEDGESKNEEDPTLIFSTLLIAKPLPFKFDLTVRDMERARFVHELFLEQKAKGEFTDSKEYCKCFITEPCEALIHIGGDNHGSGKEFGWVKV